MVELLFIEVCPVRDSGNGMAGSRVGMTFPSRVIDPGNFAGKRDWLFTCRYLKYVLSKSILGYISHMYSSYVRNGL